MAHRERPRVTVLPDQAALFQAGTERVLTIGNEAIAARGAFHLALAGGSTPRGLYALLADAELATRLDWSRVHIYFGDERCVPPDHADSNYRMARESLLDRLPVAPAAVNRIAGEIEPDQAAADYAALLKRQLPGAGFDLVLLGLGPDGHIASLFPESRALTQRIPVTAVYVPKLTAWRVTVTFPVLNRARHLLLLVSGSQKADVMRHVLRAIKHAMPLPVQMLRPLGEMEWLLDADAARHLDRPVN